MLSGDWHVTYSRSIGALNGAYILPRLVLPRRRWFRRPRAVVLNVVLVTTLMGKRLHKVTYKNSCLQTDHLMKDWRLKHNSLKGLHKVTSKIIGLYKPLPGKEQSWMSRESITVWKGTYRRKTGERLCKVTSKIVAYINLYEGIIWWKIEGACWWKIEGARKSFAWGWQRKKKNVPRLYMHSRWVYSDYTCIVNARIVTIRAKPSWKNE